MAAIDEMRQYVPEEFRDVAKGAWNPSRTIFYVYRLDGVEYSKEKKRGIDKRTQLGSIKDGVWRFSPAYLREQEKLHRQQQVEASNPIKATLEKKEIQQVVETVQQ